MIAPARQLDLPGQPLRGDRLGAGAPIECSHCSLPVPAGLVRENSDLQFCCRGCETVYTVIHAHGLERYYALRDASNPDAPEPARVRADGYAEYDDPAFQRLHVSTTAAGLSRIDLYLEGIHCAACVWLIERLPQITNGVIESRLDFRRSLLSITWDPASVQLSRIAQTLNSLGYPPHPARDASARRARSREDRQWIIRIGVAGALAGNVMLIAIALYAGLFGGMEAAHTAFFRILSLALGVISLAWPGAVFFRSAWGALRAKTLSLDVPIAVGLAAGGVSGFINTIRGSGEIYFDSLTALVFLLLVGRWIQRRQQRRAADSVALLYSLTPTSATRLDPETGARSEVSIESLQTGDIVEVIAGASIPADGFVTEGASTVDQSILTGESRPIEVQTGDRVAAGAVNLAAPIRMVVEATGAETRVGGMMRLVEEGARRRAPIVQAADRLAGRFVAAVLIIASLTVVVWLFIDPSRAIEHAVSLLIVTCPCALALATPLAIAVAIGRAARRGILIKGGDALERLATPGTILLDKTGTITRGSAALAHWSGDDDIRPLVAALEATSNHPVAKALVNGLGGAPHLEVVHAHHTLGGGVEGRVSGRTLAVGSRAFVLQRHIELPNWAEGLEITYATRGLTPIFVAVDGAVAAVAAIGDPIRPDAHDAVDRLHRLGWTVGVLSGDHPQVAAVVASDLGVDAAHTWGGAAPETKLDLVRDLSVRGETIVMVGDGVNDAPALAAASVGVSVHAGAEASLAAADVSLSREGLAPLVELVEGAQRTVKAIHRNLRVSLCYNLICATLAVTGIITPLIAAVLMPVSSLTVIALSIRARTFGVR